MYVPCSVPDPCLTPFRSFSFCGIPTDIVYQPFATMSSGRRTFFSRFAQGSVCPRQIRASLYQTNDRAVLLHRKGDFFRFFRTGMLSIAFSGCAWNFTQNHSRICAAPLVLCARLWYTIRYKRSICNLFIQYAHRRFLL